jgi:outer membrane protein assembly factor BamB
VDDSVLVVDRSGRLTLHNSADGTVRWARHLRSLEGVRSRPAFAGGLIYVPFVDGRLNVVHVRDGSVMATEDVGRPIGDAAAVGEIAALVTTARRVVGYRGVRRVLDVPLSSDATTGAVAAHGAFWVGNAAGSVDRVDPAGGVRTIALPGSNTTVLSVVATPTGTLVTNAEGSLYVLDPQGALQWRTDGLGDLVGAPAQAGDLVAVVDRQGRMLSFDRRTGAPKGQVNLQASAVGGILGIGHVFLATLEDGRLWIQDANGPRLLADVAIGPTGGAFAPGSLGGGRVGLATKGGLSVIDVDALVAPTPTDDSPTR